MVIKKINPNGHLHIPTKIREQLSSDEVSLTVTTDDNGKNIIVIRPIKEDKKPTIIYK